MIPTDRFEQVEVAGIEALRAWLSTNHDRPEGVWLVTWKRSRAERYVARSDVIDELLCWGRTDGLGRWREPMPAA